MTHGGSDTCAADAWGRESSCGRQQRRSSNTGCEWYVMVCCAQRKNGCPGVCMVLLPFGAGPSVCICSGCTAHNCCMHMHSRCAI